MRKLNLVAILFIFFFIEMSYAQDIIYLRKDTIRAKIQEVGATKLKYQEKEMPVKEIKTRDILKIEYQNGSAENFGNNNPRKLKPLSLGLLISNPLSEENYVAEIEMNYFIKPYFTLSFDAGGDINGDLYLSAGPRYYINRLNSTNKLVPYIGCQLGIAYIKGSNNKSGILFQLPFGIDYITKRGFNFALEYKPITISNYESSADLIGIKIGKNF